MIEHRGSHERVVELASDRGPEEHPREPKGPQGGPGEPKRNREGTKGGQGGTKGAQGWPLRSPWVSPGGPGAFLETMQKHVFSIVMVLGAPWCPLVPQNAIWVIKINDFSKQNKKRFRGRPCKHARTSQNHTFIADARRNCEASDILATPLRRPRILERNLDTPVGSFYCPVWSKHMWAKRTRKNKFNKTQNST